MAVTNPGSGMKIRKNIPLAELLGRATPEELEAIVDGLLGQDVERVLNDDTRRQSIQLRRQQGGLQYITDIIALEICSLGSNTIANVFRRGKPVGYDEVVHDVAKEMKLKVEKRASVAAVEEAILVGLLAQTIDGKSEDEIEELLTEEGCAPDAGMLGTIKNSDTSSSLASDLSARLGKLQLASLLGGGGRVAAKSGIVRAAGGLGLLPGLAAAAAWNTYARSSPAMESLIPVVVKLAFIRQRLVNADHEKFLKELQVCL